MIETLIAIGIAMLVMVGCVYVAWWSRRKDRRQKWL